MLVCPDCRAACDDAFRCPRCGSAATSVVEGEGRRAAATGGVAVPLVSPARLLVSGTRLGPYLVEGV